MLFTVKLFPEITIKSRPVRRRLVRQLRKNLRSVIAQIDPAVKVIGEWDSLEVQTSCDDTDHDRQVVAVLANTPGIAIAQKVDKFALPDMDGIAALAEKFYAEQLTGKTFAVRCKRSGRHQFKSIDVERSVGSVLNQQTGAKGVQLVNPDVTVQLEIRHQDLYIVREQVRGLGGFPLGCQDGVLSLISGGFDSSVSSYLSNKRGLLTHYCFFNLGGAAHEVAVKEVALYLWMKYGSSHRVMFVSVPFEAVVGEILKNVADSQMGVVLKRMMLRAASSVAEQLQLQALVTGESVAQVSSQTLTNLTVIDAVTDTMVLRPLATADKQDIIDIARDIGTEQFSKNIPEYCAVISVKPTTRAKIERIEREESGFDFGILDDSIKNANYQVINNIASDINRKPAEVEIKSSVADADILIDIRHPHEEEMKPLAAANQVELVKIPFYELRSQFGELDQSKNYLLYCGRGMMSRLHAAYLEDEGFANVGVYDPA